MILGIGVDLVHIPRVMHALERFGPRFARRVLDGEEFAEYERIATHAGSDANRGARFVAMRFAAKEAASKALGTGFRRGVAPSQFGIRQDSLGAPFLVCHGRAAEVVAARGEATTLHVSLADERDYAVAFVTLSLKSVDPA